MTLTKCNHIITEIYLLVENMPLTVLFSDPEKRECARILIQARLKNEIIETNE